jgi:tetratricopeptide (TPR) repeat protein
VLDLKNAGNAAFGEGNYDEAIEAYNKALMLKPPADLESIICGNISLTLLNMGKLTEALEAADNAIFADERRARNHFRRSRVLHNMGMYTSALDALWKAQELSPYDVSIDLAVAQVHHHHHHHHYNSNKCPWTPQHSHHG